MPPRAAQDTTLILLSNREPYEHVRHGGTIRVRKPPGGLVSALDPTMRRTQGVWVAWESGNADAETADEKGRLGVPPEAPEYTLRRVWLDEGDVEHYYLGFANSVLWPMCHQIGEHVRFDERDWRCYVQVNERFARAVNDEARQSTRPVTVWVQDYHFALVADLLRAANPSLFIHQFWHIPFPSPTALRELPAEVRERLIRGMLGNDLVEFQTAKYADNFIACVRDAIAGATADGDRRITLPNGRHVDVGVFPISIDVEQFESIASTDETARKVQVLRERYGADGREIGVCVDRVDYTKGIPERLRALDLLWTRWPELRGRFTFIIVATPSRSELSVYRALESEVVATVRSINRRYGQPDWTPIVLINENVDAELLAVIYRAADLCVVSSLQDGMNLVAKEFIACQKDERGVLVLSRFAGAAEEIDQALLIDPHDTDEFAEGIRLGFAMTREERREHIHAMREQLAHATIFDWLDAIQERVSALRAERPPAEAPVPVAVEGARVTREPVERRRHVDRRVTEAPHLGA